MAGAARKAVTPVPGSQEYWGRIFMQAAAGAETNHRSTLLSDIVQASNPIGTDKLTAAEQQSSDERIRIAVQTAVGRENSVAVAQRYPGRLANSQLPYSRKPLLLVVSPNRGLEIFCEARCERTREMKYAAFPP